MHHEQPNYHLLNNKETEVTTADEITFGAWVFGGGTYHYVKGDRMGKLPDEDLSDYDAMRVNLAVKAIQNLLVAHGYDPRRQDGVFGWWTRYAVKKFQVENAVAFTNGAVGRTTMGELLRSLVQRNGNHFNVPRHIMAGVPIHESGWDPAAVGSSTPIEKGIDRGLFQINSLAHPDVPDELAFDAVFNLNWGAKSLRARYERYKDSEFAPPWDAAIYANLSPVSADAWAFKGTEPSEKGLQFIEEVHALGRAFWDR